MIDAYTGQTFSAALTNAPPGRAGTLGVQVLDPRTATAVVARTTAITEFPVNSGFYFAQLQSPDDAGDYLVLWDDPGTSTTAEEVLRVKGLPTGPTPPAGLPTTRADIRVLIPRVRRAVEGFAATLTDDQVKDLVADAIADIILYTGGLFGKDLVVTAVEYGIPTEYATSVPLTLPEGSIIAAQAALDYIGRELALSKTSETIRDEGQEWTYALSAQAITERLKTLRDSRDRALEMVAARNYVPVSFTSFLEERDRRVAWQVEPPWGEGTYYGYLTR